MLIYLIRFYQMAISPFMGHCCRFVPTCSEYAIQAIEKHGPFKGTWLSVKRISKCHPFCRGGVDFP